ncbi:MAG: YcdB/YcdC domain-containing protein [Bhargavaea sp.]
MESVIRWFEKFLPYLDGLNIEDIKAKGTDCPPGSWMLCKKSGGEPVGELHLDSRGGIRYFQNIHAEDRTPVVALSPQAIRDRAGQFVGEVFGAEAEDLQFSSVVDLENVYTIDFVRVDEDGLELPNSGLSLAFQKDGVLYELVSYLGPLVLIDEQKTISSEAALDLYMANLSAELKISKYDSEIYVDGDDEFRLIYDFLTGSPDEVKMDGTVISLAEDLGIRPPDHEPLGKGTLEAESRADDAYRIALDSAIKALFKRFPGAEQRFLMRKESGNSSESGKSTFSFIFDRHQNGIQIEDEGVEIEVDRKTGEVVRFEISDAAERDFSPLLKERPFSMRAAKALFVSDISMRPVRTRNEAAGGVPVYELVYIPVFPDPGGHIHAIDAHSLEKWTVDTGSLLEG